MQILEASKPTEDMKLRLESFCTCPSTYELNIIKNCRGCFIGTSSKWHKFWGQKFKKISYKTEFYNFLSFIFMEVLISQVETPLGMILKKKQNLIFQIS